MLLLSFLAAPVAAASVLDACREGLNPPDDQACERHLSGRPRGTEEAKACMQLENPLHRLECTEWVKELKHDTVRSIQVCSDTYGTGVDAMRCMKAIAESATDPFPDIEACSAHLKDPAQSLACVKRFRSVTWAAAPAVEACSRWADPEACLAAFVQPALFRDPESEKLVPVIGACQSSFPDEKSQLKCLSNPHGHSLVLACSRLDQVEKRSECLKRGGAGRFDTGAIVNACVDSVGGGVDALRCLNAVEDASADPVADIRVCSTLSEPSQRIKCAARFADVAYDPTPAVEGCRSFPDPVQCLAAIVRSGEAPSYLGLEPCQRAFPGDPENGARCIRASRNADVAFVQQVERCATEADGEQRLSCITGR